MISRRSPSSALLVAVVSVLWLAFGVEANAGDAGFSTLGPDWSEAQKASQREAAIKLLAELQVEIAAGKKDLVIPPGDYRFDSPPKDVLFTALQDAVIHAEGVVFWFDSRTGRRLLFKQCRNVTLKGLTIDTDPLPWLQGTISAVDKKMRTMDFAADPGYRIPEGAALSGHKRVLFFDGQTSLELPIYDDGVVRMENLGDGKIRLAKFASDRAFLDPVILREVQPGDRVAVLLEGATGGGVGLMECSGMRLEDITLYGSGCFAYHEAKGEGGNTYLRCKLVRRPQTNRLMASTRDCFHSFLMQKGPRIENCEFSHAADDLIAIHGFFGVVLEKLSPKEYLLLSPYGSIFRESSVLKVIDPLSGVIRGQAVVAGSAADESPEIVKAARSLPGKLKAEKGISIRSLDDAHVFKVTLDREFDAKLYDLVSCADYSGRGAVVKNNFLHDGHVRGILAKTEDLLIQDNVVERTGHGGIVLTPEYFWLEGPVTSNIRVIGNQLHHNGWSAFDRVGITSSIAAIEVGAHFGKRLFPRTFVAGSLNSGLEIRDNKITEPAGFGILVMNATDVTISNNVITQPFAAGPQPVFYNFSKLPDPGAGYSQEETIKLNDPYYSIFLFATRNAVISGNSSEKPPPFLKGTEASVGSTIGEGSR